jgi:hypothetical protein
MAFTVERRGAYVEALCKAEEAGEKGYADRLRRIIELLDLGIEPEQVMSYNVAHTTIARLRPAARDSGVPACASK